MRVALALVLAGGLVGSSSAMAQAAVAVEKSALEIVASVTAKGAGPSVLSPEAVLKSEQMIISSAPSILVGEKPIFAGIGAGDFKNSVVGQSENSQSLITVLRNGTSSAEFALSAPEGFNPELAPDGSIQLRSTEGNLILPFINKPWALDATGKQLPTTYSLVENKIIQDVDNRNAVYPIVADPSIQWVPLPVLALYGAQIEGIAKLTASIFVAVPGGTCTLAAVSGWVGKAFAAVCSLIGLGAAKDVFTNIANIWRSNIGLIRNGCYGLSLTNFGAKPVPFPPEIAAGR